MTIVRTLLAVSMTAGVLAASGLTIISPTDGSPASPGQTLTVSVDVSTPVSQVLIAGEGPIGFSAARTSPPYTFTVTLPANLPAGSYSLTALGVSGGTNVNSTPVTLAVERADAPVQFDVQPTMLNLPAGQRTTLRVVGTYADGATIDNTHSLTTSFSSTVPAVAAVDNQGNVTAISPGMAQIVVNNSLRIPITVPDVLLVTPQYPIVYASQSSQFNVVGAGTAALDVTWTIRPQVGKISNDGTYTAPKQVLDQQLITVTATSRTNPPKIVSTGVVLFPPISLSVFPAGPVVLRAGESQRFGQSVMNALDQQVDWSISARSPGTIDSFGLYTAPATITSLQTVTITATSIADSSKVATSTVQLQP